MGISKKKNSFTGNKILHVSANGLVHIFQAKA